MICDKCGGLVVRVDDEEGKCTACSKRFWKDDRPVEAATQEPALVPQLASNGRRCQKVLAIAGTQCRTTAEHDARYCKRHRSGADGLVPNDIEPGKRSKTLKQSVAAWDAKHLPAIPTPSPIPPQVVAAPQPIKLPDRYMEPSHVSFTVRIDKPGDWISFGRTWMEAYPDFRLAVCEPINSDEPMNFNVVLENP